VTETPPTPFTVFDGHRVLVRGAAGEAAVAFKRAEEGGAAGPLLAFDADGRQVDFDLRGSVEDILARHAPPPTEPRGPGRPRLGVTAREVTLLPRHWDWLAAQPGGASVALRKLVEAARLDGEGVRRSARDAAYRFMSAMAGDLPGFEEASRALFADDGERFRNLVAEWPRDVRDHVLSLARLAEA
jgi:hypothetical protein